MGISEPADLAYTRVIITHVLHELRRPVRRTQLIQTVRRWTGREFFHLAQKSRKPTQVGLAETGIVPLWELTERDRRSPDDTARATLGQTWTVNHDDLSTVIVLVVDRDATAWLVSSHRDRYPATPDGWRRMLDTVAPGTTGDRGGRGHRGQNAD
jgi:hypothetical protein